MNGKKRTQRIMLGIAFLLVLAGLVITACEMYEVIEPIKLFGKLNFGIVLIVLGGIVTFLAPKPARKKKKYRGY